MASPDTDRLLTRNAPAPTRIDVAHGLAAHPDPGVTLYQMISTVSISNVTTMKQTPPTRHWSKNSFRVLRTAPP